MKAFEAGTQFAKEMGIQEFIMEGNFLTISNALAEQSLASIFVTPIIYGITSFEVQCVEFSMFLDQIIVLLIY